MSEPVAPTVTRFVQDPKTYAWTFGGYDAVRRIRPGEVLDVYVEDCFDGRIKSTADLPSKSIEFPFINPQTGPFFVEGAEKGDTLAIHLIDVRPARDWAVSAHVLFFGSLSGTRYTATLQEALRKRSGSIGSTRHGMSWPSTPSIQSTRSASRSSHSTARSGWRRPRSNGATVLVPEAFGGNMDTPEAKAGTTIYLGVNVDGGLFSIGDGHYRMGEGEVCGAAVEGAMNTTFTVDVIKGIFAEWPRLESDDSIMVAGSYRPLEDAFRIAHSQLVRWVVTETGLSLSDAYQLISQIATSRIANVVDPNYTIVAKVPKRYLPRDIGWMGGVHDRLRTIGRAVLATTVS